MVILNELQNNNKPSYIYKPFFDVSIVLEGPLDSMGQLLRETYLQKMGIHHCVSNNEEVCSLRKNIQGISWI